MVAGRADYDSCSDRASRGHLAPAVFDVSQTEPLPGVDPAPLDPPGEPVTGDSHAGLLAPLERHAGSLGYKSATSRSTAAPATALPARHGSSSTPLCLRTEG